MVMKELKKFKINNRYILDKFIKNWVGGYLCRDILRKKSMEII